MAGEAEIVDQHQVAAKQGIDQNADRVVGEAAGRAPR
jgi:hypothetical protein